MSHLPMRIHSMITDPQRQHGRRRGCSADAGSLMFAALVTLAVLSIVGGMLVLASSILRHRLCDATALIDVLRVGKAIEKLHRETPAFTQAVCGPAAVPQLPGVSLARETTMFVQYRSADDRPHYLVRGSHPSGHSAFVYTDGHLYATEAPPPYWTTWMHWMEDLKAVADSEKGGTNLVANAWSAKPAP